MVYENGPFRFDVNTSHLKLNDFAWNKKANLLYIESPGSVGFSIGPEENSD
jgi:serine carboxypeptidase-like clade 2